MSQRKSGYKRKRRDGYDTPEWVTEALLPFIPVPPLVIWECATGKGKMARVLSKAGYTVFQTDISDGTDFLKAPLSPCDWIITNPPFALAQEFIERALSHKVNFAFLLRVDYDSAVTRAHLFETCRAFSQKIILRKRIRWIEGSKGSPSYNHAWYIWKKRNNHLPTIGYGP